MARIKIELIVDLDEIDKKDFDTQEEYFEAVDNAAEQLDLNEYDYTYELIK